MAVSIGLEPIELFRLDGLANRSFTIQGNSPYLPNMRSHENVKKSTTQAIKTKDNTGCMLIVVFVVPSSSFFRVNKNKSDIGF